MQTRAPESMLDRVLRHRASAGEMINQKLITEVGRSQRVELLTTLKRSANGLAVRELAAHFGMSYMGVKQHCIQLERDGYLDTLRRPKAIGRPEMVYRLTARAHALFNRHGNGESHTGVSGAQRLTADLLEAVRRTYGPAAPEKLLFSVFARWAEEYRARLTDCEDLPERAAGLARLRDAEGYIAAVDPPPAPAATVDAGTVEAPADEQDDAAPHRTVVFTSPPPVSWTRAGVSAGPAAAGQPPDRLRIIENHSPLEALLRAYPILARLERELFERVLGCPVQRNDASTPGIYRCVFELER